MPANLCISKIQDNLVKHGAIGFQLEYEQGTGRIKALKFLLEFNGDRLPFQLPVDWRAFQRVLERDGVKRWDDEDYCYRVAWANLRDWVDSQMAMLSTQMVTIEQIFLPYFIYKDGQTVTQKFISNPQLLLN